MPEVVIDTMILQKANAPLTKAPGEASLFRRRLRLLQRIQDGDLTALKSAPLIAEYRRQVAEPRNDFVRVFLDLIDHPTRSILNWKKRWSGADHEARRKCRFPREDVHVLRTAIRQDTETTIYSEEHRIIVSDGCIYRAFRVHVRDLP
jgi:hypothetical protein